MRDSIELVNANTKERSDAVSSILTLKKRRIDFGENDIDDFSVPSENNDSADSLQPLYPKSVTSEHRELQTDLMVEAIRQIEHDNKMGLINR